MATVMANGAPPADAHNHTKHNMGVTHLMSEEVEAAFSPLSSSTITIASLGSSLGYGNNKGSDAGAKSPVRKGIGSHALSKGADTLDSDEEAATDDGSGGGFGSASSHAREKDARDLGLRDMGPNSRSYSSANMSSTAGSPSSVSSRDSVELPHVGMRSVSVDHAPAYGLHMLPPGLRNAPSNNTAAQENAGMGEVNGQSAGSASPQVPSQSMADARKSPQAGQMADIAGAARRTASSSAGVMGASRRTRPHRSLTQRLLHPLGRKQATGPDAGDSAGKEGAASEIGRRIVSTAEQSQSASTASDTNKRRYAETRSSASSARTGDSAHVSARMPSAATAAAMSAPIVEEPAPNTDSIGIPPHSAVPSRSLEIKRTEALLSRAPLSRRIIQRAKREDAIYGNAGGADKVYGKDKTVVGPARFQELPRSLVSRLGFSSLLAERRRPGDLRFVIAPHAQLAEVIEVFDCDEKAAVYRKVSRSGKSWHETFHAIDAEAEAEAEAEAAAVAAATGPFSYYPGVGNGNRMVSDYEMASALGLPYPGIGVANPYGSPGSSQLMFGGGAAASCVTFQSSSSSAGRGQTPMRASAGAYGGGDIHAFDEPAALTNSSSASFVNIAAGTARMARASTSVGYALGGRRDTMAASMYGGAASVGVPYDKQLLWEALTPFPNQFPLHIKDSRTIIDTVSLSSMVLDRNNFCYRFQLGTNRMRWIAKRARKNQLALQCFVRNSLVAEVFVDYEKGYSPYNMSAPQGPSAGSNGTGTTAVGRSVGFGDSNTTSGMSTPIEAFDSGSEGVGVAAVGSFSPAQLPEDGSLPLVTILPIAFDQLAGYEEDVVESFIIFTGMQMLECLHI
ncbi:hypothetical protein H4R20_002380 [Coemansia guatemalensis]|uniref:Uncharacterized protein n=1 Tax=Coemansia guatemalensis TaxID=2761395 RepID=A0A9W8HXR0_9FUNG|nr:hypothetical protein H4R20_002380 [Coemansia guatemalensis]